MTRRCSECARPIAGRRNRLTCSTRCRVARGRRLARLAALARLAETWPRD